MGNKELSASLTFLDGVPARPTDASNGCAGSQSAVVRASITQRRHGYRYRRRTSGIPRLLVGPQMRCLAQKWQLCIDAMRDFREL